MDGLALSNDPILAGWEYLSKQKPDRAITKCIVDFPQTHINARFLSHIDNFGSPLDDRFHLVFLTFVRQKKQATIRPPRRILPILK
jgi:hypothetical protein